MMTPEEIAAVEAKLFKGWRTGDQVLAALDAVKERLERDVVPHQTPHGLSRQTWVAFVHDLLNAELKRTLSAGEEPKGTEEEANSGE